MSNINFILSAQDLASATINKVGGTLDGLAKSTSALDANFAKIGIAATVAGTSISLAIKSAIDTADQFNDLSQRIGIAVKDLASFKLAADQSGTSMEAIAKGVKELSKNMVENGAAFRDVGVNSTEANKAIMDIADLFQAMPDGIEKTTLATKLFGKSGMELIPLLNLGSEGLKKSADASAEYAAIMSIIAPQADQFNDSLAEIKNSAQTVTAKFAEAFLPTLNVFASEVAAGAKNTDVFSGAISALKTTLETILIVGANVGFVFKTIGNEIGAMAARIEALARGDFKGFSNIGEMARQDAEKARQELDDFTTRLLNPPKPQAATNDQEISAIEKKTEAFRKLYTSLSGGSTVTQAAASDFERLMKTISEKTAVEEAAAKATEKLTEGEKLRAKTIAAVEAGQLKLSATEKKSVDIALEKLITQEKLNEANEKAKKQLEEQRKLESERLKSLISATDALEKRVEAAKLENEEIGLTQEQLAHKCGMTARSISRIENGKGCFLNIFNGNTWSRF